MKPKTLVVGGKGYIGSHLQSIFPHYIYTGRKDFDLNNKNEIEKFCENIDIDICLILSAKISYDKDINIFEEPFKTNVNGLNNLLITLNKKNRDMKIVYFSSMTVYDQDNISPVLETANLLPLHSYGLSKVYAEDLIKFYKFNSAIIRIPGVYGGSRKSGFIYNTIKKLQNNEDIDIDTEDLGYWETIYINDIIELLISFLSKYKFTDKCEIFNIAYGEKVDFIETVWFLKKQLNSNSTINISKKYKDIYLSNEKISKHIDIDVNYYDSLKIYLKSLV